ncbi:MAG: 3-deoxy-manno-octulosonate cytidylyltransferase [Candidatus Pedobacter colombiensis]|uniref:3-deoxy-manno-octulosonate cytidylyltransferase n=1 Tax=Candidatus Pedobacter colombiensis TaxID=3121371 RepID=A0AAJ5W7W1_9SPHI|nr:3-deoxy-manno-octulosonate cytidylyltransferase [Pedobacter sp.]WEK19657.1 MAG: 3-deoxy-manno-octulosonate cytidylyltransferase [Pedobacter sp.]
MRILGVLPARMAATRFPNKPLAIIQGIPMIGHCYLRSKMCDLLDEVYVATCDEEIKDYVEGIGGKAIMTSDVHERATERSAEALLNIEKLTGQKFDIVVMIQGDEPLIYPEMIKEVLQPMIANPIPVSNLIAALPTQQERDNSNNVKVAKDFNGRILYLSREAIPSKQKYNGKIDAFRQLGLIAFTKEALLQFVSLEPTPLEVIESVDMNRFLEHGVPIQSAITNFEADSVDTPEDLVRVDLKMATDRLFTKYKN